MRGPYDVAKQGGRHSGYLKQAERWTAAERGKRSKGLQKQIEGHEAKVATPEKYVEGYAELDPREQAGIVKSWEKEISNWMEQQQILDALDLE